MNDNELVDWLMKNGGPVVRYKTTKELISKSDIDIDKLTQDLVNDNGVRKLLTILDDKDKVNIMTWHGSGKYQFENVMGKLLELGLSADIKEFDDKLKPYREWIYDKDPNDPNVVTLTSIFIASCFVRAGYKYKEFIDFVLKRIDLLYKSAKEKIYDIYLIGDELKGIPKKFSHECIKLELNPYRNNKPLPLIHDIYALAYLPKDIINDDVRTKINAIVEYILDERFQEIREGYGYLYLPDKKYCHSSGWSPTFPGYKDFEFEGIDKNKFFMRFELMSHFKKAQKSRWFQKCLNHLERYRTQDGTYIFPSDYLKEKPSGYYVLGAYMGLEDKRTQKALELESTLRMLSIKNRINNN